MNVEDYQNMWLEGESLHRMHMLQSHSTKSSNGLFIIFPLLFFDRVDTTAANMKIKTMNYSIKLILTITQFVVVLRGCRMELMVVVYCCIQMDKIIWGVNLTTEALYVCMVAVSLFMWNCNLRQLFKMRIWEISWSLLNDAENFGVNFWKCYLQRKGSQT
jgi:hypothetical protein